MTVYADSNLYQAILSRRSVRRYDAQPLDEGTLAQVREIVDQVEPLVPENRFAAQPRRQQSGANWGALIGGYGHFLSPPHFLVPFVVGERHPLLDLGYRTEQIAVRLSAMGIGSCFVGALHREEVLRARFGLPAGARLAALLVFGRPTQALGGRAVNSLLRLATGATSKLAADRLFYRDTFAETVAPPPKLAPLIEAGRNAPSAVDAQPWRFLWRDGRLFLFVRVRNRRYGTGAGQDYRFHDAGGCLANISLALAAVGRAALWQIYEGDEAEIPEHPSELQPLASLPLA